MMGCCNQGDTELCKIKGDVERDFGRLSFLGLVAVLSA